MNKIYGISSLYVSFILLLLLTTITFTLDTDKCGKGNVTLFFHHLLNVFAYTGWLSNDKLILQIYLIMPVIVGFHWLTNSGKCVLTQIHEDDCPSNRGFQDIFFVFGSRCNKIIYAKIVYLILVYFIAFLKYKRITCSGKI